MMLMPSSSSFSSSSSFLLLLLPPPPPPPPSFFLLLLLLSQALADSGELEAGSLDEVLELCGSEMAEVRRVAVETVTVLAKRNAGHAAAVDTVRPGSAFVP
eukprot:2945782-Rhodomonas_salina.2